MFSNLQLIIDSLYMCSANKLVIQSNTTICESTILHVTIELLLAYNYMKTIKHKNQHFQVTVKHFNI